MADAETTVTFEDKGQDFLEWDLDANGIVVACRPFQAYVWVGVEVLTCPIVVGEPVEYLTGIINLDPMLGRYNVKHVQAISKNGTKIPSRPSRNEAEGT